MSEVESLDDAKSEFDDVLDGGFEALYQRRATDLAVELSRGDPAVWNPLKHWLRERAKSTDGATASFVDDWLKTVYDKSSDPTRGEDGAASMFQTGDHVELAARLAREVEEGGPVVWDIGDFFRYDPGSGVWSPIYERDLATKICSYSGDPVASASPNKPSRPLRVTSGTIDGVTRVYREHTDQSGTRDAPGFFDGAPAGVMFDDAFLRVDLDRGDIEVEAPDPDHRSLMSAGCSIEGPKHAPLFDEYLSSVFDGDEDKAAKARLLVEYAACCLAGIATRFEKALVLYDATQRSQGSNGKSAFIKIMYQLFPPSVRSSVSPVEFDERFTRAELAGRRINFVTEMPEDSSIIEGEHLKAVISGDPIKAERKNEDPFFFRPEAGHLFACNEFPSIRDTSDAFRRRWLVCPFRNTFGPEDADPRLPDKIIEQEKAAVMRQLADALADLVRRGHFSVPGECERAASNWWREANPVEQFLIDETKNYTAEGYIGNLDGDKAKWTKSAELFEAYKSWCAFWGFQSLGRTRFGKRVGKMLDKKKKKGYPSYRVRLKPKHERIEGREEGDFGF